jgi:hypothetical protein
LPPNDAYVGGQRLPDAVDQRNAIDFLVRMTLGQMATATVVRVEAVSNAGDLSPVGTVDVLPLVAQLDGAGNATPHATVFSLPYFRLQGGTDAVILDPKVGDLGLAVFASRDISSVKVNKAPANPGSRRQYDMADGLYLGGFLNGTPEQYVRFHEGGIQIVSPGDIEIQAGGDVTVTADGTATVTAPTVTVDGADSVTVTSAAIELDGPVHITGAVTGDSTAVFTGAVTGAGIGLSTHKHIGVTTGGGTSGTPVP